jgi:MFS family permease
LFRAVTGTGEAFYYPAATSILSDYHGQSTRSFAMSVHQTSVYLGIVSSGALAGYIGQEYGWHRAFLLFGAVGLVLALVLSFVLRESQRGESDWTERKLAPSCVPVCTLALRQRLVESFPSPTAVVLMLPGPGAVSAGQLRKDWRGRAPQSL